jgi:arginase
MRLRIVTVPYRYDDPEAGLGLGPRALLEAGLEARLVEQGIELASLGTAHLPENERDESRRAVNIGRLGANVASLVAEARSDAEGVLALAGDDTAAIGIVAGLQRAAGATAAIGVVWLDAHGDFNTPETTYSRILAGMPLAVLAGLAGPHWREAAGLSATIPTDRIVIAGVRDLDAQEETLLRSTSAKIVTANELRSNEALRPAIETLAAKCDLLSIHVDLDVLDPHLVPSATTPSENGLSLAEARAAIGAALGTGKAACLTFTSLNPGGGERGRRSVQSALSLIEASVGDWAEQSDLP